MSTILVKCISIKIIIRNILIYLVEKISELLIFSLGGNVYLKVNFPIFIMIESFLSASVKIIPADTIC